MRHIEKEVKKKDQGYTPFQTFLRPLYGRSIWPGIRSRYSIGPTCKPGQRYNGCIKCCDGLVITTVGDQTAKRDLKIADALGVSVHELIDNDSEDVSLS
jgi:hypothetical protein